MDGWDLITKKACRDYLLSSMFQVPERSPLRELGGKSGYRGSGSHQPQHHDGPAVLDTPIHIKESAPVKETLPQAAPVKRRPRTSPPKWETADYSFDQEHAYESHVQRMASSSGPTSMPSLRRQNAVRTPFGRVRDAVKRFLRHHLLRKSSKVSFHFTKAYLTRNTSFVITPDISAWNMKFRKRDLIKKRPRPLSWQSARPVKAFRGAEAMARTAGHHATGALRELAMSNTSPDGANDVKANDSTGGDSWTKVSLPAQPGYGPEPILRKVSGPRPAPGTQSPTPESRGLRGPRPISAPAGPVAISVTPNPIITSAPGPMPNHRFSAIIPRRQEDELAGLALYENDPDPVDVSEALQFVDAWSSYLRRAIAQRALLRKTFENSDISRNGGNLSASSESDDGFSADSDGPQILEELLVATPSQAGGSNEARFGTPGPLVIQPTMTKSRKRVSQMSTLSDMSLGEIQEVRRVPTLKSITARYSHLFGSHGIREIDTSWVPEAENSDSGDIPAENSESGDMPAGGKNGDEGMWVSGQLGEDTTAWQATDSD
ncbi:hypothetical protein B9G98_03904 [Wickerhamiella sorbophila]|uniref:Uncharacterized protein n=1 Tax=Wickerhamiella sorbophila TaxID=45607 RepID=A0A2T0FMS2_9ASCO|nr:hypothetical protein B9G98_03904 [Wickerhamiella sorbophila]PRT56284.1 hypothetical protein B9G98_03904 [Wickerhamiella sorbophila]